nr:RagB/SusD family nutrient uptake outer membrane protein [Pedobacter panaciterrae]
MKNRLTYIAALFIGAQFMGSCKKDLDVNPRERILESNYYKTPEQAFSSLISVYDQFGNQSGGYLTKLNIFSSGSDDHYAGGDSPSDLGDLQAMNNYTVSSLSGAPSYLWSKGFTGAYRANIFLQKVADIQMDANTKNRYIAEAKALRAIFYFDLVRIFKNIPLILKPVEAGDWYNILQVPPADVYKQIEIDLKEAIPNLPVTVPRNTEGGRLTQGAAHALLGKVYLWQEKFADAATEFADVNGPSPGTTPSKYGYILMSKFEDLYKLSNKFNVESILEISYNSTSNMGWGNVGSGEGNVAGIMSGPRNYNILIPDKAPDYVSGWSVMPFTKEFFALIHFDPRNKPTVANLDSLEKAGIVTYKHANDNTGYFVEKYAGRVSTKANSGQLELNFPYNLYEIRLADTYLMEAEAVLKSGGPTGPGSRAYAALNAVRSRVGLKPVDVNMDNIMKERRIELAAEGQRWFDLVRWGLAPAKLAFKGFVPGKNETLPIPNAELNNTKIIQSKEWGGTK